MICSSVLCKSRRMVPLTGPCADIANRMDPRDVVCYPAEILDVLGGGNRG